MDVVAYASHRAEWGIKRFLIAVRMFGTHVVYYRVFDLKTVQKAFSLIRFDFESNNINQIQKWVIILNILVFIVYKVLEY